MAGRGSKPGEKRGGRKKGVPNKITTAVKDMVRQALEQAGGIEYLVAQAKENPGSFMTLIGKIIPSEVVANVAVRHVARMPAVEQGAEAWAKRYSPTAPARKQ